MSKFTELDVKDQIEVYIPNYFLCNSDTFTCDGYLYGVSSSNEQALDTDGISFKELSKTGKYGKYIILLVDASRERSFDVFIYSINFSSSSHFSNKFKVSVPHSNQAGIC